MKIHRSIGLGITKNNIDMAAHLTPKKEAEVILTGRDMNRDLYKAIHHVLRCYRDYLGIKSFNMAIWIPEDTPEWRYFPTVVRLVSRGDPMNKTSDIGAMELYAASVISTDPYTVAHQLARKGITI